MTGVFISYSRKDEVFARQIATDLERLKADVWLDVEDIPPGSNWSNKIQEGLKTCNLMMLILSPDAMASPNVEDEWQFFMDHKKPIIPVMWRLAETHFQLNRLQYVDFSKAAGNAAIADQPAYQVGLYLLRTAMVRNGIKLKTVPKPKIAFDSQLKKLNHATRVWQGPFGFVLTYHPVYGLVALALAVLFGVTALVLGGKLLGSSSEPTPKPGIFAHPADLEEILPTASEVGLPDEMQVEPTLTVTYTLSELVAILRALGLPDIADATEAAGEKNGLIAQVGHGWRVKAGVCPDTGQTEYQVIISLFNSESGAQAHLGDKDLWAAQIASGSFSKTEPAGKGLLAVGERQHESCGSMVFYTKFIPHGRFVIASAAQVTADKSKEEVVAELDRTNAYMVQKLDLAGLR